MSTATNLSVPTPAPVTRARRSLTPDLTRGVMLLFIAVANAANCAFAGPPLEPHPHGIERVINMVMAVLDDSRAYPVFAVMFGYGLVQIARRQGDAARGVLLRRNAWLVAFGLAHATLLYFGDFLGAYGIVGIVCTLLLVRRSPRFHRLVIWLWGVQLLYVGVLLVLFLTGASSGHAQLESPRTPSLSASSYGASLVDRLQEWPVHTATVIPFIVIVWLGIWAAQHRVLEEPGRHLRVLRLVAAGCLGVSMIGALPYALMVGGIVHVDRATLDAAATVHAVSGEYGGPGYVALLALVGHALTTRGLQQRVRWVAALGQRSLSGYLFQSAAWLVLFNPWSLDLGGSGLVSAVAALAVWTVSVLAAQRMDTLGYRGPAETVLRRLTYGRAGSRD